MSKQWDLFNSDTSIVIGDVDSNRFDIDLGDTVTVGDTMYSICDTDSASFSWNILDDMFQSTNIQIGRYTVDEAMLAKISTLLDVIESLEDDHELKALYNTQLSFNKLQD